MKWIESVRGWLRTWIIVDTVTQGMKDDLHSLTQTCEKNKYRIEELEIAQARLVEDVLKLKEGR